MKSGTVAKVTGQPVAYNGPEDPEMFCSLYRGETVEVLGDEDEFGTVWALGRSSRRAQLINVSSLTVVE